MYTSHSLEKILSHLSVRVMDVIADGRCLEHLGPLLEFLAVWEERPHYLIQMAYQWCSTVSEAVGAPRSASLCDDSPRPIPPTTPEDRFSEVGPGCDLLRLDGTSHQKPRHSPSREDHIRLLSLALKVGFRLVDPFSDQLALHSGHSTHHDRMFETAFSSDDDETVADAVCAWVADGDRRPPDSFARYFAERLGSDTPFSSRLRCMGIRALERMWGGELEMLRAETIHFLNRLEADVEDIADEDAWGRLLLSPIRSPSGPEGLSSHNWGVLDGLVPPSWDDPEYLSSRDVEVMRSIEEAGEWEKLDVWMMVVWGLRASSTSSHSMEEVERVTLELLLRRPSALPRFEELCEQDPLQSPDQETLRRICDRALAERLSPESSLSP